MSGETRDDLDDYVAECDEHVSAARRLLLDLEATREVASADTEQIDGLFRAFHTIKGLSGMVGAKVAEDAAHRLEAYLGAVRKGQILFTDRGVDALLEGLAIIEVAVDAFRTGKDAPDLSSFADLLGQLLPDRPSAKTKACIDPASSPRPDQLSADRHAKLEAALSRGECAWRVTFTPSAALAERGVNVNNVRERLQLTGAILRAEPAPASNGGIQFTFLVVGPKDADFSSLIADGSTVEPYEGLLAAGPTGPSARAGATIVPSNLVRVDLGRLDELMRGVGELVLSRSRLEMHLARLVKHLTPGDRRELEEVSQLIERQLRDLREGIMRVRMVPVRELFSRMRLVVRDLTQQTGKEVDLVVTGEETEIDKYLVERMTEPLLHLVRNAVSHGLETTAERTGQGKSPRGRLDLRASAPGGTIVLEIEDDGRGVQVNDVFARARAAGLIAADAPVDPAAVLDLICTPGFSTRDEADRASGRGVGMDIVRRMVESVGGSLALDSKPGLGTRITARLPLTLVVAEVLTLAVGTQVYAIPRGAVREVLSIEPGSTTLLQNNELVRYRGRVLPLLWLGELLHAARPCGSFVALVIGDGAASLALGADRAIGLREVVVRALADPLVQVPGVGGATELGDGRPILILDPVGIARQGRLRIKPSTLRN